MEQPSLWNPTFVTSVTAMFDNDHKGYLLIMHGGAGTMSREGSTPEQRVRYKMGIRAALEAGYAVLRSGGEAMDATVATVSVLEDNPLFNAGKGAVFNVAGKNELETSLMLSKPPATGDTGIPVSRRGVGITLLSHVKNPSKLARALYMAPTLLPHTFISGPTAELLAESLGEELVPSSYFFTKQRWIEHRRGLGLPDDDEKIGEELPLLDLQPTGTVGAVALDIRGCIASLTSTGGRTNKLVGRIGDTPHMGSGFWAEQWPSSTGWVNRLLDRIRGTSSEQAVGISGTGDGDYFIRCSTAVTIAHRVRYLGESLQKAADYAVNELRENGGIGGIIALDNQKNAVFALNCPGMYRGIIREDGVPLTAIFDDDILE
ncbi:hypothetical protein MIND_00045300 [Mycena indigotica]|uniref:Asparaginase n=1 Tax=Mycena indigotica TaxID=2126181 RepID=A0A8H6TCR2_9AGAR|nr:uncharacterized protein MIND_00045300 [Mycena indigotica]KAF7315308.1 hypothetical protein MIND_00045300 [Mycena indigotica]